MCLESTCVYHCLLVEGLVVVLNWLVVLVFILYTGARRGVGLLMTVGLELAGFVLLAVLLQLQLLQGDGLLLRLSLNRRNLGWTHQVWLA
jgi:hypothetical protein